MVHSVIRSIAPHVGVVDLVHDLPPFDVRAAALALSRAVQYVAPGIVLAVVDPGVGGDRRAIAVEVGEDGEGVLVGPDNGLLAPAVAMSGGAVRAVSLENPEYQLASPGPTFAGRDIFAPAAAHLANGVALTDLGPEIDPYGLVPGLIPLSRVEGDAILGEVLWVDRYGNCQLNVDPDDVAGWDALVIHSGEGNVRRARRVVSFDELAGAEVGLLVDSYGLLTVVVSRGSAASLLHLQSGARVTLERG